LSNARLLAKSYDRSRFGNNPPDYALLVQHSRDVAAACRALADVIGPIAIDVAGLDSDQLAWLSTALRLDGWSQDLGKANSDFQSMVTTTPEIRQLVRHELISGMLLWLDPKLRRWLAPLEEVLTPAIWGAIGHHRKFDDRVQIGQGSPLTVHVAHEDFRTILADMAADLDLATPPHFECDVTLGRDRRDGADRVAVPMFHALVDTFCDTEAAYQDARARSPLALVKALGIAADVAASAVAKQGVTAARYSLDSFVRETLATTLCPDELTNLINRWAWKRHRGDAPRDLSHTPPGFAVRPFQAQVERSDSYLTLAEAGCGSGKSLAAYLWARKWCVQRKAAGTAFRLFFCLPTTGTTTEHFKDYALESGIPANLVHSRASVDLQTLAGTADQEEVDDTTSAGAKTPPSSQSAARDAMAAERSKLEALALWETRVAVTSADTVLGLMVNSRRGLCALPAILQSGIVFDEIHAFDDYLFGHLLVFLRTFPRLPVLLMTASLQESRRRALIAVRPDLQIVPGPPDLESLPRYRLEETTTDGAWNAVTDELRRGGKVLWVRNRVNWANNTYDLARGRFNGIFVDVYHSRLRYVDRSRRHRRVIDRFGREGTPALLVATQVAEMSLDLSADLLVTDEAPVPSLIQRLGRLNRRATPESPGIPKRALVETVARGDELPYAAAELSSSRAWRSNLIARGRPLSQRDLADEFLAARGENASNYDYDAAEERACFTGVPERSGLWRTRPGNTRADGYTVTVILRSDLAQFQLAHNAGQLPRSDWMRAHEVSIPMKDEAIGWERVAGIPVAPNESVLYDYDNTSHEGTGAQWRKS
jgi:CRISPR-associated endonuclease/helicase Cas3